MRPNTLDGLDVVQRDAQVWTCSHPRGRHNSYDTDGEFIGIGKAGCNGCDCTTPRERRLRGTPAHLRGTRPEVCGLPAGTAALVSSEV